MKYKLTTALVAVGVVYFILGEDFHASLMSSPENVIGNIGRSIGNALHGTASTITQYIWS